MRQLSLSSGTLIKWTKGFNIEDAVIPNYFVLLFPIFRIDNPILDYSSQVLISSVVHSQDKVGIKAA